MDKTTGNRHRMSNLSQMWTSNKLFELIILNILERTKTDKMGLQNSPNEPTIQILLRISKNFEQNRQ
jgi:hypothetical protein